jgi:hypothetical protein
MLAGLKKKFGTAKDLHVWRKTDQPSEPPIEESPMTPLEIKESKNEPAYKRNRLGSSQLPTESAGQPPMLLSDGSSKGKGVPLSKRKIPRSITLPDGTTMNDLEHSASYSQSSSAQFHVRKDAQPLTPSSKLADDDRVGRLVKKRTKTVSNQTASNSSSDIKKSMRTSQ